MKNLIILTVLLASNNIAFSAPEKEIVCHTPREARIFSIKNNSIAFTKAILFESKREVASIASVRTKKTATGFTKVLFYKGNKHTIYINNTSNFSDVEDYLVVRSREGHEMTYPLNCKTR